MYISKGSQGHTSYSESWGKSIVSNWYLFFIRHKIIIFDFVSFACSGRAKTPTNTSIVWLFWGLRLPPGSGLQIVKHMIHWPGASWQGPGQVTDSARQKKLHFFFFPCHLWDQPHLCEWSCGQHHTELSHTPMAVQRLHYCILV